MTPKNQSCESPSELSTQKYSKSVIVVEESWYLVFNGPIGAGSRKDCTLIYIGKDKRKAFRAAADAKPAVVMMGNDGF